VEPESALVSPSERLIMIVDDDEHVRDLMQMSFEMEGFQVITADNGIDAASKIGGRVHLITADLMMPGQGGWEFLRDLQAKGFLVPVVVISASKLDDTTIDLIRREANVVEFIPKPVTVAALVQAIHKHLKTKAKTKN
jgi:CheY-like chemotaxis protein